ncbi:MAG TPA: hypothetical protein PLU24_06105 [Candidatus Omnitrophota bacterium]|nr:hypothetical protein [Candidatus Omnitrophota bacterium]
MASFSIDIKKTAAYLLIFISGYNCLPELGRMSQFDTNLYLLKNRLKRINEYGMNRSFDRVIDSINSKRAAKIDLSGMYSAIESLADETGVSIEGMTPKGSRKVMIKSGKFEITELSLSIYGNEKDFLGFLTGMDNLGFLAKISDLSVISDPKNDGSVRGSLKLEKITSCNQ